MSKRQKALKVRAKPPGSVIDLGPLAKNPEEVFRTEQAAILLGQRPNTLTNWRYRGRGPAFYKIGRVAFYRAGDLLTFMAQQRREPRAA